MSLSAFTKIPVPALELEYPMHYADSAVSEAKLRETSVSTELKSKLHRHILNLKLKAQYAEHLNIYDFIAKVHSIGVSNHPTVNKSEKRQVLFASSLIVLLFQFDDHFEATDPLHLTLESIAKRSKEMRSVLSSLSAHNLSGLQGSLEEWPAAVPGKEAYLWLLREADDLREGTAELVHDTFVDYCHGVLMEIIEWQSDMYRGDFTAWNLDRYKEVRKRSSGVIFGTVGILYITQKWIQKEHITTCTDLLYEAAIVVSFGNDILGKNRDSVDSSVIDITSLKIATSSNIVLKHNTMVKALHSKVLELEGDTRHFMEEMEASVVGLFLWQLYSKRYL
nr:bicyclogermacrene synthase uBuTS-3 [Bubarida sp. uBuTS-3]